MSAPAQEFDIAIVGGGMVGLSLAAALAPLPWKVVVIEPVSAGDEVQPSFDSRTTALSTGSHRILGGIGVWPAVASQATPIRQIHVSERGAFAFARLTAEEQGVAALGYTLENRILGGALAEVCARAPRLQIRCPASVVAVEPGAGRVTLRLQDGSSVAARLVVAADGARSRVREAFDIDASVWDYDQRAVITNIETERFHEHVAYERFTDSGPVAILPVAEGRCGVVWTLAPEAAERVLALDDAQFIAELQEIFGYRLGHIRRVGRRQSYPLSLTRSARQVAPRAVIIGNAAQGLHPIAGQGFNLGLRDVAALAEVLADASLLPAPDPGSAEVLARYEQWRRPDRKSVIAFTDALVRVFANPLLPLRKARAGGLLLFDLMGPAKQGFARVTMGLAGKQPRLARGLPLLDEARRA